MNTLEFSFSEFPAFASLVAELNKQGVPYTLKKDAHAIAITIGKGF